MQKAEDRSNQRSARNRGRERSEQRAEGEWRQNRLPPGIVALMAVMVGVIVANIYYIQPLLEQIARTFHLTVTRAGTVAMLSQAGTATGMFLFVPLGDKLERRTLIVALILGACLALLLMAVAPNAVWLGVASFAVGTFAANVHVVVPFAAHLAAPAQRGRVVGTVVAGILVGVLLARTFSGMIGALLGWRAVYLIAAGVMLLLAGIVRARLPHSQPEVSISWSQLMISTWHLFQRYSLLREAALLGALFFAAFSAFWTTLVFFFASSSFHYASPGAAAGCFGLVGALGAAGAPLVGHLADKHGPRFTIRIALWLALSSFLFMGLVGSQLIALIAGVILMDLGVQSGHVSNQTRIYSIDPSARGRLNMVYMFCYFVGGGLGSYGGAVCWHLAGWPGVCGFAAGVLTFALLVETTYGRTERRSGAVIG